MVRYTHGHHESVLRSHRWRTAANSAAYLLPHLDPGQTCSTSAAGRAPSPRTWPTWWRRRVTAVEPTRGGARRWPARRPPRAACDNVDFAVADVHALDFPDDTFDVVHAHQVLQHVGDPVRRCARCAGCAGRAASWRRGTATTPAFAWYPAAPGAGRVAGALPAGGPRQRRRARRRPAAAVVGAGGRLHRRHRASSHVVLRHAGGPRLVGRHVGRPDPSTRPWRSRRVAAGVATEADLQPHLAPAGAPGRPPTTAGSSILHGEILCRA